MSLQLVLGRAKSGKTSWCINQINRYLSEDLLGPPLIMLIPEQASYQTELALATSSGLNGTLRVQTLSFKRLEWHVLSEAGGTQEIIGDLGKRMILRQILLRHRNSLEAFARIADRPGLADQLAQTLREFKLYQITIQDIKQISLSNKLLSNKISDTAFILEQYQALLGDRLDAEDELTYVAENIEQSSMIKNAFIWIDGFTGFTTQELQIIEKLIVLANKVFITLPLDARYSLEDGQQPLGEDFFAISQETYHQLKRIAYNHGILIEPDIVLKAEPRGVNKHLQHLEQFFFRYPTNAYRSQSEEDLPIKLLPGINKHHEFEEVAREIWQLIQNGHRWNQIAILSRELETNQDLLTKTLELYEIPYYLDSKHTVSEHPIIDLILAALEIIDTNWSYEALFRCLKTGFFGLEKDAIDRLENYCIEYGISGREWSSDNSWYLSPDRITTEIATCLNEARTHVFNTIMPLYSAYTKQQPCNVKELTKLVYHFLIDLDAAATLAEWAKEAHHSGDHRTAQIHEQIWDAVMEVFDQIVLGLGEETLSLSDYSSILQTGLECMQLGTIPMGQDQVFIGSLERSRIPEFKSVFIINATEGVLPRRMESVGIFSETEREALISGGLNIPGKKILLNQEYFFIYNALTRPTEYLYLTFSLTDDEGQPLEPSPIIHRLRTLFPDLAQTFHSPFDESLRLICRPRPLLPLYTAKLQRVREGEEWSAFWTTLEQALENNPQTKHFIKTANSIHRQINQESNIPRELTRRIYGKQLKLSVSRLEQFVRCPFAHYMHHGLRLKERRKYQVSYPDLGNFFHQILRSFALEVKQRELNWGDLSRSESWQLIEELSQTIIPEIQNKILLSSARYRYLTRKLKRTAYYAVTVLGEHARKGVFVPTHFEVKFGPGETIPGRTIPLSMGESLVLTGQIDRIDRLELGNAIYLRIIDYKSSETALNLDSVFHGLSLQLLTYLDVALDGAVLELTTKNEVIPAGILYFPVLEPLLTETSPLPQDKLDELKMKSVKVKGYLLAERAVLESMDKDLKEGDSQLLGLRVTAKKEFRKDAPLLSLKDFADLREYLHNLLYQKGEQLFNGDISITPYRHGQKTGCDYCIFRAICRFDANLNENRYRVLPKIKDDEVLERIVELNEVSEKDASHSNPSTINWLDDAITERGGEKGE